MEVTTEIGRLIGLIKTAALASPRDVVGDPLPHPIAQKTRVASAAMKNAGWKRFSYIWVALG
jgi:hypothetical protein